MFKATTQAVTTRQFTRPLTRNGDTLMFTYELRRVHVPTNTVQGTLPIDDDLALDYQIIADRSGTLYITFDPIHTGN